MITTNGVTINGKVYRNLENQVAWLTEQVNKKGVGAAAAYIRKVLTREDLGGGVAIVSATIDVPDIDFTNGMVLYQFNTFPCITKDYSYVTITYANGKISIFGIGVGMSVDSYDISFIVIPTIEAAQPSIDITQYPNINIVTSTTEEVQFTDNLATIEVGTLNVPTGSNVYVVPSTEATKTFLNENQVYLTNIFPANSLVFKSLTTASANTSLSLSFYSEPNGTAQSYIYLLK